jgi:hypothetical protein
MAVGGNGAIVTSTDQGHTWTQLNSGITNIWLHGVTWSGMQYIVVGESNTILSSPDGTIWTSRFPPLFGRDVILLSVAWSGNGFVAAGYEQFYPNSGLKTVIFNSTDGKTWTENTYSADGTIITVIWANNQYVAVGQVNGGTANGLPIILTSSDGLRWTNGSNSIGFGKGISLHDITWTGTKYVAVGNGLTATSSDGITWNVNDNISWNPNGVAWSGHKLMACGNDGFYSSTDGLNWSQTNIERYPNFGIAWSGFQYVSVGAFAGQTILVSPH